MTRISCWLLAACFCLPLTMAVGNETGKSGLTNMWQSQVMVGGQGDRIAEIHLHVHDDRATSYFEIRSPGFRETVGFDDLNPRGVPFREIHPDNPEQGAREWAELKAEIYRYEGRKDVTIELVTVPQTTLYALTTSGGLQAIDAETGQTRWKTRIGSALEPTIGLAANNTRLIAVRGSRVYCLDAMTGDEIWSRYSHYAPGGGVAMSEDFAYVTSVEGRLQMFPLNETGLPEAFFSSTGAATFDPAVTAKTVSWPTTRGFFNVARSNVVSLRYRLETSDVFESPGAAVGGMLVANSVYGKVYALDEERGNLAWEFAVGEPMAKKPVAIGDNVAMLISIRNNLIPLDVKKGTILDGWPRRISGITNYVGASQNVLYFMDNSGNLVGLNRESGATVSRSSVGLNALPIPNHVTDRLYIAQPDGAVYCMRELGNVNPAIIGDEFEVGSAADEATGEGDAEGQANPFAPGAKSADPDDPFAGPAKAGEETKTADPDDPFAGGGDKKDPDDPFGGGDDGDDKSSDDDDPFGGDDDDKSSDDDDPFGDG